MVVNSQANPKITMNALGEKYNVLLPVIFAFWPLVTKITNRLVNIFGLKM
jgi:hypothetical protein